MEARSGSIKEPIYYPSGESSLSQSRQGDAPATTPAGDVARGSGGSAELGIEDGADALKVPRKFISNWRQACDRTRDRTKDLLKRWRTVPSHVGSEHRPIGDSEASVSVDRSVVSSVDQPSWTVHVWTTWVSRYPSDESLSAVDEIGKSASDALAPIQRDKFAHFFTFLLDHDRDGFIGTKNFDMLSERLRRFADWSWNGPEYLRLLELEKRFVEALFGNETDKQIDLDDWLCWWAQLVAPQGGTSYPDLPLWVKVIPRIFFLAINTSHSGTIRKQELEAFYSTFVGLDQDRVDRCVEIAYNSMTSNGDHPLGWPQYELVFANFLFGRGPFGPGEHFLGLTDSCFLRGESVPFPIDYSAMNTPKERLEVYSPNMKTNRRSVVV